MSLPSKISAFQARGSKLNILYWVLSLLPKCNHFIEPFCNSATVLLNRNKSQLESINDINSNVTNFFEILRNSPDQLIEKINNTFIDESDYMGCFDKLQDGVEPLERARCFYMRSMLGFSGIGGQQRGRGGFGYLMNSKHSRSYSLSTDKLKIISERLKNVQIFNRDAIQLIERIDKANDDVLIYCDPPYLKSTVRYNGGSYDYYMNEEQHIDLLNVLVKSSHKIAISSYNNDLYNDMLNGWNIYNCNNVDRTMRCVVECVYTNYDPNLNQIAIFD